MNINTPLLCKERGRVINPKHTTFGGLDLDVEFLDKCECEGTCNYDKLYLGSAKN
jgi:hypothetical protein